MPLGDIGSVSYHASMTLAGRDRDIAKLVAVFKAATFEQIRAVCFGKNSSRTPCDRALKRLVEHRYLARTDAGRGRSDQYAYRLGLEGRKLFPDAPTLKTTFLAHTLAILDTYITLHRLHHHSIINLIGYLAEPECWMEVSDYRLKPDLFVELQRRGSTTPMKIWFEVDRGTEGPSQIKTRFETYWFAYRMARLDEWPVVVFIAEEERCKELRWLLRQGNKEAQALFRIMTLGELERSFID